MDDDFCLIHGYGFMRKHSIFDKFTYCAECERLADIKRATIALKQPGFLSLSDLKKDLSL